MDVTGLYGPLGVRSRDGCTIQYHLRLLRGWRPVDGIHASVWDLYEVERYAPHTWSHDRLAAHLRALASAALGTWFCIQWYDATPHVLSWRRYPSMELRLDKIHEFMADGTIVGARGVLDVDPKELEALLEARRVREERRRMRRNTVKASKTEISVRDEKR